MKSRHWIYLGLVAALITLVAVPLYFYNMPLGPALALEKSNSPPGEPAPPQGELAQPQPAAQLASILAQQGTCGGNGVMTLLVLGLSHPLTPGARGSDAIRLVMVDFDEPAVTILAMPPNLWVQTPNLEGISASTLTGAYWHAKDQARGGIVPADRKATQELAQVLYDNFVFEPDHYLTVNQPVFAEAVDTLDGITIYLDQAVDGSAEGFGYYPAGENELDGPRTLDYVRILQPNGQPPDEWGRFLRQNQVLQAILDAALQPDNWDKAPQLAKDFRQLVTTSLSVNFLLDLTCMLEEVGASAELTEIPKYMVTAGLNDVLFPDTPAITAFIAEKMGGSP
jgi:LCP family protein required for cell wall assembly